MRTGPQVDSSSSSNNNNNNSSNNNTTTTTTTNNNNNNNNHLPVSVKIGRGGHLHVAHGEEGCEGEEEGEAEQEDVDVLPGALIGGFAIVGGGGGAESLLGIRKLEPHCESVTTEVPGTATLLVRVIQYSPAAPFK